MMYLSDEEIAGIEAWCVEQRITEIECMIPDLSGVPRGKILPTQKFLHGLANRGHRLPESIFNQSITGEWSDDEDLIDIADHDVILRPDPATIRHVPWYEEPTAQVICDCYDFAGQPVDVYSRQILRNVVALFEAEELSPIVAPELEFFLVAKNADPDVPLCPPIGRNGRPETARQCYGIDAVNEFDPFFEEVYDFCEAQKIDIDTLNHEAGAAQIEINFRHGAPIALADQVFLFKRTVRQTALKHGIYATFMAKPMQREPGSAMHIHHSMTDQKTNRNLFSESDGSASAAFLHFIGGLQHYSPAAVPFYAPNVNSYRRFAFPDVAINTQWGTDNRSCGFRVPRGEVENRRVENRLCGSDVNPYLGIALSLLCGYLGMRDELAPMPEMTGNGFLPDRGLPMHFIHACRLLRDCQAFHEVLGTRFIETYCTTKEVEFDHYAHVISSWEREHLLLNV